MFIPVYTLLAQAQIPSSVQHIQSIGSNRIPRHNLNLKIFTHHLLNLGPKFIFYGSAVTIRSSTRIPTTCKKPQQGIHCPKCRYSNFAELIILECRYNNIVVGLSVESFLCI